MVRRRNRRDIPAGAIANFKINAEQPRKVTLADGSALDLADPASILAYCDRELAMNVTPTSAQLQRIEMLRDMADRLPPKQRTLYDTLPSHAPTLKEILARKAAREEAKRSGGGNGST